MFYHCSIAYPPVSLYVCLICKAGVQMTHCLNMAALIEAHWVILAESKDIQEAVTYEISKGTV